MVSTSSQIKSFERTSVSKPTLTPEQKAKLAAKKGELLNGSAWEASKNVRYVGLNNNIFSNSLQETSGIKAARETASAVAISATPMPEMTFSNRQNALQMLLTGNFVKSGENRGNTFALKKSDRSLRQQTKQDEGNTFSVERKNARELFAQRFGNNRDSIFVS